MTNANKNEQDFLKNYNPNAFDKPSLTTDIVILTIKNKKLCALLTKRTEHPYQNQWSLIGGFVNLNESLDQAAKRVLKQKGKLENIYLEQLYTFGAVNRDPRMRIISVSYYALTNASQLKENNTLKLFEIDVPGQGQNSDNVNLLDDTNTVHKLAFDHQEIIGMTVERIRGKLEYVPIGFELLPERFTLRQIQEVHETILSKKLNKDAFRRKLLASKVIEATGDYEQGKGFRPAEYYIYKGI